MGEGEQGVQGEQGIRGKTGRRGAIGATGPRGLRAEDGQSLPYWKARRTIRNVVWLAGALLIAYLLLLNLQKSRDLEKAVNEKEAVKSEQVADLSQLLQLVERAETAAKEAGRRPTITMDQAVAALRKTFPPELVEQAAMQAAKHEPPLTPTSSTATTATTRPATTTTATPTTTTTRAPPTTTTTVPPTTTTTRCVVNILYLVKVGC